MQDQSDRIRVAFLIGFAALTEIGVVIYIAYPSIVPAFAAHVSVDAVDILFSAAVMFVILWYVVGAPTRHVTGHYWVNTPARITARRVLWLLAYLAAVMLLVGGRR